MMGVAIGLGNIWRFPSMTGSFGGAAFVLAYVGCVALIGVPALMAEWALGRHTRRGPVGALAAAGLPGGTVIGWTLFAVVACATAYYTNVVGWVLWHAAGSVLPVPAAAILPPEGGVAPRSLGLQILCTGSVIALAALVLVRGLRRGAEAVSRLVTPLLFAALLVVLVRAVTLPGAGAGLRWFLGDVRFSALSPEVLAAALGQAVFSLALGGTFMVVYGSYLRDDEPLGRAALWTAVGDTTAGLVAGLAIFPAVFALGLAPTSGPTLLFETLPAVFDRLPAGGALGLLFYAGLCGVAFLSVLAALEVLVAGLTDAVGWPRSRAVRVVVLAVFLLALPPMINMRIFVPWDLAFGSGAQTAGAFAAAVTVGWAWQRGPAVRALGHRGVYLWVRFVIPLAIGIVAVWWLVTTW